MPRLKANGSTLQKNENYEQICELLKELNYYSNDELMEIALFKYEHDFRSHRQLTYTFNLLGIKRDAPIKFEQVRIDSTFRFMNEIEKLEKQREGKKKYEKQINEKLERLKAMDAKSEEQDNEQY